MGETAELAVYHGRQKKGGGEKEGQRQVLATRSAESQGKKEEAALKQKMIERQKEKESKEIIQMEMFMKKLKDSFSEGLITTDSFEFMYKAAVDMLESNDISTSTLYWMRKNLDTLQAEAKEQKEIEASSKERSARWRKQKQQNLQFITDAKKKEE